MKLKGISKLVLAGTALAATAATLTTATYAWYVTNSKVDATGVAGQVASSSSGSLFISKNKVDTTDNNKDKPDDYTNFIELAAAQQASDVNTGAYTVSALNPQSKCIAASDGKYYYVSSDTSKQNAKTYYVVGANTDPFDTIADPTEAQFKAGEIYEMSTTQVWVDQDGKLVATPSLITFKFWLKADQGGTAAVKLMLDNTSASVNSQVVQNTAGTPTAITAIGQNITADAMFALRMDVTQQNGVGEAAASTTNYQLDKISKDKTGNAAYSSDTSTAHTQATPVVFTDLTGGDANKYYRAILKRAGYGTDADDAGKSTDVNTGLASWPSVTLQPGVDTLLTFNVWLEGSDAECWDSCRGQTFTLDFNFELQSQQQQQQNP